MGREAFADRQRAIRAEAAAQVREAIALRANDAAIRRGLEAMRAHVARRSAGRGDATGPHGPNAAP
jgi:hypothetical protein